MTNNSKDLSTVAASNEAPALEGNDVLILLGQQQAFDYMAKLTAVGNLVKIAEIKKRKLFKQLTYIDPDGNCRHVGSFDEFCKNHLNQSRSSVDEKLQNLEHFGEEFLDAGQKLGLGTREMRKLRKLPEEELVQIEDRVVNANDKAEVIDLIEDIIESKKDIERQNSDLSHELAHTGSQLDSARITISELQDQLKDKSNRSPYLPVIGEIREESTVLTAQIMDCLDRMEHLMEMLGGDETQTLLSRQDDCAYQMSAAATTLHLNLTAVHAKAAYRMSLFKELLGDQYAITDDGSQPVMTEEEATRVASRIDVLLSSADNAAIVRKAARDDKQRKGPGRPAGSKNKKSAAK